MLIETQAGFDYTTADCRTWMAGICFRYSYTEPLAGPGSMVVGTSHSIWTAVQSGPSVRLPATRYVRLATRVARPGCDQLWSIKVTLWCRGPIVTGKSALSLRELAGSLWPAGRCRRFPLARLEPGPMRW